MSAMQNGSEIAVQATAAALVEVELVDDQMLTWRLWQLVDSSFPTGAFAHSGGLEAASHAGLLPAADVATLESWLAAQAASACSLTLPFVLAALPLGRRRDAAAAAALSASLGAHLAGSGAAKRASAAAGSAMLRAGGAAFPELAGAMDAARDACLPAPPHGAVALGYLCGALGVPPAQAGRALLFAQLRDGCSAATRLGLVGPMAAAALQARAAPRCEALLRAALAADVAPEDAAAASPLADALQCGHDALFARLFQS